MQPVRQLPDALYGFWNWLVDALNHNEGVVAAIAAAIAASALAVTIFYENKSFKMRGLDLVFAKTNDTKKRDARRIILSAYARHLERHDLKMEFTVRDFWKKDYPTPDLEADQDIMREFPKLKEEMETIKSDLEEIAVMENHGMISHRAYLNAYWVVC
jgi:hypothetical protein